MSGFFGIVMSNTLPSISSTTGSAVSNATTSSITASAINTGGGTLTYSWAKSGNSCAFNTPSGVSTTITGGNLVGTTNIYCNITNSVTGVTKPSPECLITWSAAPSANLTASVANFSTITFSWTAVTNCTYQLWYSTNNVSYSLLTNNITGTTTNYNGPSNTTWYYYVIAISSFGNSTRSRIAQVNVGQASGSSTVPWDSGLVNLSPLCLSGSAGPTSGTVGLKSFVQGTYGILIDQSTANSGTLNTGFSSLLYGTATRSITWNLNGTAGGFLVAGSSSAPAPWSGNPQTKNVTPLSGTVTYELVASGTGWSTNNSGGVSGVFWATISWRNTGTSTTITPAVNPTVSYIA